MINNLSNKIFIVIVNYNGIKDTLDCVKSIRNNYSKTDLDIIVVDNNSSGDDVAILKEKFLDEIIIIESKENLGFSGGNNLGIEFALSKDANFILLLNNDTIVQENFIPELLKPFASDKLIGVTSPKINYYDNPEIIWSAGGYLSKIKGSGFADSDKHEKNVLGLNRNVTFASGCCLMVKSEVFKEIGLLDNNYFLYVEDTDLCARIIAAGYKINITDKTTVLHKVGSTTKSNSEYLPLYYNTRNRLYFVKKNFPEFRFLNMFYITIVMFVKSLVWTISGNPKKMKFIFEALKDSSKGVVGKKDFGGLL